MRWRTYSLGAVIVAGTVTIMSAYHFLPSKAIKRACDIDARRLCPHEYATKDYPGLRSCMYRNKAFVGSRCGTAWMREHSGDTGETGK